MSFHASTSNLIKELGRILISMSGYSRAKERYISNREAQKEWGKNRNLWCCAICGRMKPRVRFIAAAHIRSLEENGSTDISNLIPLCDGYGHLSKALEQTLNCYHKEIVKRQNAKYNRNVINGEMSLSESLFQGLVRTQGKYTESDIGCHKLYDLGLISRNDIKRIVKNPKKTMST